MQFNVVSINGVTLSTTKQVFRSISVDTDRYSHQSINGISSSVVLCIHCIFYDGKLRYIGCLFYLFPISKTQHTVQSVAKQNGFRALRDNLLGAPFHALNFSPDFDKIANEGFYK